MAYRAVGNRCAVDIDVLQLSVSWEKVLEILRSKGFRLIEINLIALARQCIGKSRYCYGARPSEAPAVVDCSSFVKWLYAQYGIWLPRRTIQQRELGEKVRFDEIIGGDLVFVSGRHDYYLGDNSDDGVGHVGIATRKGTVIHAANKRTGIVEVSLAEFIGKRSKFRGARRYIPKNRAIFVFETPIKREIEVADDIRWIVQQELRNA